MKANKTRKALQIMILASDMPIPDFEYKKVDEELSELEKLSSKEILRKVYDNSYGIYFCPTCNGTVWQNKDESKYCFRCGQKLEW